MNKRVNIVTLMMIASLCLSPLAMADENDDIPTNAQNTGYHDSLVAALSHANLVSTLQGDGPFTVYLLLVLKVLMTFYFGMLTWMIFLYLLIFVFSITTKDMLI